MTDFGRVDATHIRGVNVDDADKADGKALTYDAATKKLKYAAAAGDGVANAIVADANPGRVMRWCILIVFDGTEADTIKCAVSNLFNGDTIASIDNIGKGATVGDFSLTSDGVELEIRAGAFTGNVVFARGDLGGNSSEIAVISEVYDWDGAICLVCADPTTDVAVDLTTIPEFKSIETEVFYITDA